MSFSAHKSDAASPRPGRWYGRSHDEGGTSSVSATVELPESVQAACETIDQYLAGALTTAKRARLRAELDALGPEPGR